MALVQKLAIPNCNPLRYESRMKLALYYGQTPHTSCLVGEVDVGALAKADWGCPAGDEPTGGAVWAPGPGVVMGSEGGGGAS